MTYDKINPVATRRKRATKAGCFMIKNLLLISILISTEGRLLAAEGDTYSFSWLDPDKEVFVLQNRKYRKKGRLHLNAGGG